MLTLMGRGQSVWRRRRSTCSSTRCSRQAETGAVSWLQYAFRLMCRSACSASPLPRPCCPSCHDRRERNDEAVRDTVANGVSLMLMLNVPASVGLIVLAHPIVRVILERGRFTAADTAATAAALQFYALGLLAYSVVRIVSPIFYALGRSRTPVTISVMTVLVNAGLNVMLVRVLGFRGLALGTSIAALFNAATLLTLLRRELHGIHDGGSSARSCASAPQPARWVSWPPAESMLETRWPGGALLCRSFVFPSPSACRSSCLVPPRGCCASASSTRVSRSSNADSDDDRDEIPFAGIPRSWWRPPISSSTASATSSRRCCRC